MKMIRKARPATGMSSLCCQFQSDYDTLPVDKRDTILQAACGMKYGWDYGTSLWTRALYFWGVLEEFRGQRPVDIVKGSQLSATPPCAL